jgi:hypothetical protein
VHTHPHTQCTYVLEGEFVFTIEGAEHTVRPGDTLAFASGEAHGCVCPAGGCADRRFRPDAGGLYPVKEAVFEWARRSPTTLTAS